MFEFCVGTDTINIFKEDECIRLREQNIKKISLDCEIFMDGGITRNQVEQLACVLEGNGLSVETSHPPFGSYNEPFGVISQKARRSEEIEWMREFIERCGLLHMKAIPLHTGGAMLPGSQDWEVELAYDYVNSLLPSAERAGVKIAIENTNHANPIGWYKGVRSDIELNRNIWEYDDTDKIIRFVESINSDMVGICYDTGHSHLQGKVIEDMQAFKNKIILFHLHDNDGAYNDSHMQPGYGNTPWFELADIMEQQEYENVPYFIEAGPRFGDLKDMLREVSAIFEKRVMAGPGGFLKKDRDSGKIIIL